MAKRRGGRSVGSNGCASPRPQPRRRARRRGRPRRRPPRRRRTPRGSNAREAAQRRIQPQRWRRTPRRKPSRRARGWPRTSRRACGSLRPSPTRVEAHRVPSSRARSLPRPTRTTLRHLHVRTTLSATPKPRAPSFHAASNVHVRNLPNERVGTPTREPRNAASERLHVRCKRSSDGSADGWTIPSESTHPVHGKTTKQDVLGRNKNETGWEALGANVRQTIPMSPTLAAEVRLGA
mmetsp:Transcript_4467/g.28443  ORF Transcript_4467/g.28443 Transcript_4467/m.28443 type:complete len:236 (-) Transcript_4467:1111-1818(-)